MKNAKNAKKSVAAAAAAPAVVTVTPVDQAPGSIWAGANSVTLKSEFIAALRGVKNATETLKGVFEKVRFAIIGKGQGTRDARKLLRATLLAWAMEAGFNKETASSIVSRTMSDAGLKVNDTKKEKSNPEKEKKVSSLIRLAKKEFPGASDDELASLFRAAMNELSGK